MSNFHMLQASILKQTCDGEEFKGDILDLYSFTFPVQFIFNWFGKTEMATLQYSIYSVNPER